LCLFPKKWSIPLREYIIALHKQESRYKKIVKEMFLNVHRDTVGSIVCKFKVKGTVVTLPGRGRKGSCQQLQPDF